MMWCARTSRRFLAASSTPRPDAFDVIVVGSGFAGLSAAIEALKEGRKVLILERSGVAGGVSAHSSGKVAAAGSKLQAAAGITDDSPSLFFSDIMRNGGNKNFPLLAKVLADRSAETVEWLSSEIGVKFKKEVLHMQGHSVARTLSTKSGSGREIVSPLLARAVELGAQISLGVEVKSLIHAEGRIMGLTATVQDEKAISKTSEMMLRRCEMTSFSPTGNDEESAFRIQCGGIILASGGYAADTALIAAQRPNWKLSSTIPSTGKESATALKAALRCGAMPIQLDNLQLLPSCSPDEEGFGRIPYFAMGAGLPYGILVDPETGRRFVNERTSKRELSKHLMLLGHPAICIVDARGLLHSLDFNKSRPPALRAFSTLKELAASVGISQVSALQEEVDAFNKNLTNKEGVHPPEDALPISTPPFFACRLWPKVHHCLGGLQINEFSQVVDVEGSPISGLYAAGEVVGGIHGADRLGSCSITDALTFGRLAGHNLASGGVCLASSFNHQHSH